MRGRILYSKDGQTATFEVEGKAVSREEFELAFPPSEDYLDGPPGGTATTTWPMTSLALAVHARQVDEANARAKRHGIAATYNKKGECILADRNARKQLLKLEGFHDNNGGYSD